MNPEHEKEREKMIPILEDHFQKLFSRFFHHCVHNLPDKLGIFTSAFEIDHQQMALDVAEKELKLMRESIQKKV